MFKIAPNPNASKLGKPVILAQARIYVIGGTKAIMDTGLRRYDEKNSLTYWYCP